MTHFQKTQTVFFLLLLSVTAFSQKSPEGEVSVNAGIGASFLGRIASIDFVIDDGIEVEGRSTPAFVGGIDYRFHKNISIGLGGGYQVINQTFRNYTYTDMDGNEVTGEFSYSLSRLNTGVRLLGHVQNGGNVDVYFGVKAGLNIWTVSTNETIPAPSRLHVNGSTFAFQVIPIGLRANFVEHFGFFIETGVGAPSYVSAGLFLAFNNTSGTSPAK